MSTSPIYGSGGTTLVRYEVERPLLGSRGTASYQRHREYPRSTGYYTGDGYGAHPDYLSYDLPLSQRRVPGALNEGYYRDEYPQSERTTLVTRAGGTRSGQQVYIHSDGLRSYSSPSTFSSGLRTIDVGGHGGSAVVRRTGPRYTTSRSLDLPYDEYDILNEFGKIDPVTIVPAGRTGGRRLYSSVVHNSRPGFVGTGHCDYECGVGDRVLIPASRRHSTRRYL